RDYGAVETLVALSAVLVTLLRAGIPSAFFRFYYADSDMRSRVRLVRTSFWFTMAAATLGLAAGLMLAQPIREPLFGSADPRTTLVQTAFVGLWAQMNYEQLAALFRVEQRPGAFVAASAANAVITIIVSAVLVAGFEWGATGVIVGSFAGTLVVYSVLLAYRRTLLGLEFDPGLLRSMNRFGLPLVPGALALWVINFADRFFLGQISGVREVGLYSISVRLSSVVLLLVIAFSNAWPAFAYSLPETDETRRTFAYALTYLIVVCSWLALALAML